MKITTPADATQPVTRFIRDIAIDVVFSGRIGMYPPSVFLRTYDSVVDLASPNKTWTGADQLNVPVQDFVPFPNAEVILRR